MTTSRTGQVKQLVLVVILSVLVLFLVIAQNESFGHTEGDMGNKTQSGGVVNSLDDPNLLLNKTQQDTQNGLDNVLILSEESSNKSINVENIPQRVLEGENLMLVQQAINNFRLSPEVDGKSVFDDAYAPEYFRRQFNNSYPLTSGFFPFEDINGKLPYKTKIKVGSLIEELKGIEIGKDRYVIHLLACSAEEKVCWFRINGVIAKRLSHLSEFGRTEINLNPSLALRITNIEFNKCDLEVCDRFLQTYDKVEIEVDKK